ncbi:hypothetical protein M9H77_20669 [Catharanthus roseus]|uniref:Uncharacterized protein n=1 Tax=Catharanthus roseus TaxID=4058 RepID=A0ACC0AKV3_CATRO|nr:hypothetical protein M9H77_20669 [Catharanthus roseus]
MRIRPQYKVVDLHKDQRYGGYDSFVTDWVRVVKSQPRLIDVPHQDDAFQENMDIHDCSAIDVMIEEVGPLVHESRSSEELDITVEAYSEEEIPIKTPMKRPTRIPTLHPIVILMRIPTYRTLYDYVLLYLCYHYNYNFLLLVLMFIMFIN